MEVRPKPVARHRLVADQHHRPIASPRPCNNVLVDRPRPLIPRRNLPVPGQPIVLYGVDRIGHRITDTSQLTTAHSVTSVLPVLGPVPPAPVTFGTHLPAAGALPTS